MNYSGLDNYVLGGVDSVKGWCNREVFGILRVLNDFQVKGDVEGSIGEIGVYLGKFFIALHNVKRAHERSLALDLFERQELNIDASGKGASESIFRENLQRHGVDWQQCEIRALDSLTVTEKEIGEIRGAFGGFRFFSVDGGHTAEHTINDFRIAEALVSSGGVVILDDYYNVYWHGVIEGVAYLFLTGRPRLVPFAYAANKHFFTPLSNHGQYIDTLRKVLDRLKEHAEYKTITMYGHPVLSIKPKPTFYQAVQQL